jgi:hypothetical protein
MKKANTDSFRTVLTIVSGFALIYLVSGWKWSLPVAVIIGIAGVLSSWLAEKIAAAWDLLAKGLSYVIPNILLTLVFFVFLFPIAILSRLFGHSDPLKLKRPKESLFRVRTTGFPKDSFEKPW